VVFFLIGNEVSSFFTERLRCNSGMLRPFDAFLGAYKEARTSRGGLKSRLVCTQVTFRPRHLPHKSPRTQVPFHTRPPPHTTPSRKFPSPQVAFEGGRGLGWKDLCGRGLRTGSCVTQVLFLPFHARVLPHKTPSTQVHFHTIPYNPLPHTTPSNKSTLQNKHTVQIPPRALHKKGRVQVLLRAR
jgi:hypothetical protein